MLPYIAFYLSIVLGLTNAPQRRKRRL